MLWRAEKSSISRIIVRLPIGLPQMLFRPAIKLKAWIAAGSGVPRHAAPEKKPSVPGQLVDLHGLVSRPLGVHAAGSTTTPQSTCRRTSPAPSVQAASLLRQSRSVAPGSKWPTAARRSRIASSGRPFTSSSSTVGSPCLCRPPARRAGDRGILFSAAEGGAIAKQRGDAGACVAGKDGLN